MTISIFVVRLCAGFALTCLLGRFAIRANLLDFPNQRASHVIATLHGGGFSIVLIVVAYFVLQLLLDRKTPVDFISLLAGLSLVAVFSFMDDHLQENAAICFACQTVAATVLVYFAGGLQPVLFGAVRDMQPR